MIACKTYEVGTDLFSLLGVLDEYVKENNILNSRVILHIGYGKPITFDKMYLETSKFGCGVVNLNLYDTTLLIYGYTFLEEVPITHCEIEGKGVEER